jgi:Tol biopolymer transport system component
MDSLEPQPIPFTEDAAFPFWSPDGTWVGFFAADKLKKVSLKGGFAQTLCDAPNSRGGTWNAGDVILFSRGGSGTSIRRVAASGGAPADVTKGDPQRDVRHPFFLPDGRRFLYLAEGVSPDSTGIFLSSLDGGDGQRILPDKSSAVFMRSPDAGHPAEILFIRDDTLTAAPFDEKSGQIAGVARPVSEHVGLGIYASWAPLSVSNTGLLAYAAGLRGGTIQLAWFDRTGRVIQTIGPRGGDLNPEPSPDGNMLTYARRSAGSQVTDLWIRDLKRGSEAHLAAQTQAAQGSVWSPRGDEVAFGGEKNGVAGLYRKRASGSGEAELLHAGAGATVLQWSRDGRFVVYAQDDPKTKSDLWLLPMTGAPEDRKPTPLLRTSAGEGQGQLSPDGEWFAFRSNQSGRAEIYVRRFPAGDDQWMISVAGGEQPRWRGDGRELFYISADEKMMAVAIKPAANGKARLEAGVPEALFDALTPHGPAFNYVVSSDGQRFLLADTGSAGAASTPLTVITNFNAERGK